MARFSLSLLQRSHEEGGERGALAGACPIAHLPFDIAYAHL